MSMVLKRRSKRVMPRLTLPFDGSDGEWLTIPTFARKLGLTYSTIIEWCEQRTPPLAWAWRSGRRYTTMSAYYRWLAAQNGQGGDQGSGARG